MKKMKTKRFLSLLLALAMSFSMAMPAFAAPSANDPNDGIMPLATLFEGQDIIMGKGTFVSSRFTSTPGNGQHIKVWYANRTNFTATVFLFIEGQYAPVATKDIAPNTHKDVAFWYDFSDTEPVTFHVEIVEQGNNPINGYLAVAQQRIKS